MPCALINKWVEHCILGSKKMYFRARPFPFKKDQLIFIMVLTLPSNQWSPFCIQLISIRNSIYPWSLLTNVIARWLRSWRKQAWPGAGTRNVSLGARTAALKFPTPSRRGSISPWISTISFTCWHPGENHPRMNLASPVASGPSIGRKGVKDKEFASLVRAPEKVQNEKSKWKEGLDNPGTRY